MISKDYNHSSVVMSSVGNEITELGLADGQEQARIMTEFCHTKDHTRPVTAGINLMLATMAGSKKVFMARTKTVKSKTVVPVDWITLRPLNFFQYHDEQNGRTHQ